MLAMFFFSFYGDEDIDETAPAEGENEDMRGEQFLLFLCPVSSAGRALDLHSRGRRFKPVTGYQSCPRELFKRKEVASLVVYLGNKKGIY